MVEKINSFEPATGTLLWSGTVGDVDAAVDGARAAWPHWAARPLTVRIEVMRRFANVVRRHGEEFADLIARETGKPLWEARAEVENVIARIDISVAGYSERTGQKRLEGAMGARQSVRHKPHGVLAVITPYNMPANVPNGHIVPALIAGNAVVFKPSEKTPASGAMLVKLYQEAGVPAEVIQCVQGGAEQGTALAKHPGIDGLLFTGSARTGLSLNRLYAGRPDRVLALEMGGNNPIISWDTPDVHNSAVLVVQSAFLSAGQRGTSARRLIVSDALYDPLMAAVKKLADRLIVDHPHANPTPFMGPVIDMDAADGLTESFVTLMSHGGRPIKHMVRPVAGHPFLSPAIIDVTDMAERPDVELFGPLLQVVRVADFDAALAEANNTRYGLCAALFGGSPDHYNRFWSNMRCGMINWNRPLGDTPMGAPLGGVGLSGNHHAGAYYAADHCAYPVVSAETEQLRASIGVGLRDIDVAVMGD